ncbi:MAG TPA: hypothetical protein VMZ30_09700 [Pyrinomonadaceae bacterium]|nr:hypothetical protein [Pyrinomonadaceae bacterium]
MRIELIVSLLCGTLGIIGCSQTTTQAPANPPQAVGTSSSAPSASPVASNPAPAQAIGVKPKIDACALLTSKELEAVQGEALKETKLSGQSTGGFNISQCFFTLPTFTNSVSLLVAQKGEGSAAKDPREFFRERFHEKRAGEKERERERDKKKGAEEEEEEGAPPQKVSGIGDEAFWTGSRVGGAMYVLKGNSYVRISIGGPADQATKIRKTKALAAKVIGRL